MVKRLPNWLKIGLQSRFGPNFTLEFEAFFQKKLGWPGLLCILYSYLPYTTLYPKETSNGNDAGAPFAVFQDDEPTGKPPHHAQFAVFQDEVTSKPAPIFSSTMAVFQDEPTNKAGNTSSMTEVLVS